MQDSSARSNLGAILHLNGKKEEAALEYHHALRLDPGDETTLANLSKLRTGKRRQAPSWTSGAAASAQSWSSPPEPSAGRVRPEPGPVLEDMRDRTT